MSKELRVQIRERKTRTDPRLENVLQPGHESAPYIYGKELQRLRYDLIGDKQSEIRLRLRRLASMEQTVHMEDEARAIVAEIMVAASRINASNVETAAPRSEESKRKSAVKRELKKAHAPYAQLHAGKADLDWCNRITVHHLAKIWHNLRDQGYDLDRRPVRGERDCEEHVFVRKGQGWRFVGVKGGDMIFDLYRISPTGETRLPVFVQRPGRADFADQGVPPSLDSEDEGDVVLAPAEARSYIQAWNRALDIVSRNHQVTAEAEEVEEKLSDREVMVASQTVLARVLRDVSIAVEASHDDSDPLAILEDSLQSLGITDSREFCEYVKKIIPEARLQGMMRYYNGIANLLG